MKHDFNFHIGINLVVLTLMSLVRLSISTLKNRDYVNDNVIILHEENIIKKLSFIMTIIASYFHGVSLDSSIASLYRWLFCVLISLIIEILTGVVIAVAMPVAQVRRTFAIRFLDNHRKVFIFTSILLFISGASSFFERSI